jgi:rhodanese-related sulfurtransferase
MNKKTAIVGVMALIVLGSIGIIYKKQGMLVEQEESSSLAEVVLVAATDVDELLQNEKVFLLDVHIPEQMHIVGTDAVIPYNNIGSNADKLPADKDAPILVYCRSGSMSAKASKELVHMGYTNVYDLSGGIKAYQEVHEEISIDPAKKDLGTVIYGEVARTDFTLTNFTSESLKITKVSTSCGCTKAEIKKTELRPYESTVVKVSFDPAVHGDDTDLGDLTREIYISTDNSVFDQISVQISANVIKS